MCVRACVWAKLSVYMRLCDALSIERLVICKSALPWAGGVKVGRQEQKREGREGKGRGETDRRTGRRRVNDRNECEREERKECESGLYYITGFFQSPVNKTTRLRVHSRARYTHMHACARSNTFGVNKKVGLVLLCTFCIINQSHD